MSQIKERPILFSAPMVRAILEGRKTVTRRVMKIQPRSKADIGNYGLGQPFIRNPDVAKPNPECSYGRPGDRLWVRETTEVDEQTSPVVRLARYSADHLPVLYRHPEGDEYDGSVAHWDYPRRSRPSIHMPRHSSRILLEITAIRVERLQDISEEQARAEGVRLMRDDSGTWVSREGPGKLVTPWPTAKEAFSDLWNSINGPNAWDANPWVWVVEFKRVMP